MCITYIHPLLMNKNQQSVQESKLQTWASNWDQTDSKPWQSHCLILHSKISSFRNLHIAASWKQRKTLVNTSFCIWYMISQKTYFRLWMTQPAIQAKQYFSFFSLHNLYQHKNSTFCYPKWQDSPIQLSLCSLSTYTRWDNKTLRNLWDAFFSFCFFHGTRMQWYTHSCFK
jgi:hypothetical protein